MTRLRWTGPQAVAFMNHGVGEVEPGRAFSVPDHAADSFLAHAHVERADPLPAGPEEAPTLKVRKPKGGIEVAAEAQALANPPAAESTS